MMIYWRYCNANNNKNNKHFVRIVADKETLKRDAGDRVLRINALPHL